MSLFFFFLSKHGGPGSSLLGLKWHFFFFSEVFRCSLVLSLKEADLRCHGDYHIKCQNQSPASCRVTHTPFRAMGPTRAGGSPQDLGVPWTGPACLLGSLRQGSWSKSSQSLQALTPWRSAWRCGCGHQKPMATGALTHPQSVTGGAHRTLHAGKVARVACSQVGSRGWSSACGPLGRCWVRPCPGCPGSRL